LVVESDAWDYSKIVTKNLTQHVCWIIVTESTVRWFIVRENTAGWLLIPLNQRNEQGALS
jgi:hypothetical protein